MNKITGPGAGAPDLRGRITGRERKICVRAIETRALTTYFEFTWASDPVGPLSVYPGHLTASKQTRPGLKKIREITVNRDWAGSRRINARIQYGFSHAYYNAVVKAEPPEWKPNHMDEIFDITR